MDFEQTLLEVSILDNFLHQVCVFRADPPTKTTAVASDLQIHFFNAIQLLNGNYKKQVFHVLYQFCVFRSDPSTKMVAPASDWLRYFRRIHCNRWTDMTKLDRWQILLKHPLSMSIGAAVVEWLSSWLAEQEDRGSIPGLATWIFRDWFPASPLEFSEIGYLLLPSRDMAERSLKRR